MRVFLWHVHGAWTTAFVHGPHEYLIPVLPDRGPNGLGRAKTYVWPEQAIEVTPQEAAEAEVDVVILQRPQELNGLAEEWLGGRRPGRDVPAIYVEHNAPQGPINEMRHPVAGRDDLLLVHVTHFNALFWDAGGTPTRVIEHGIVDPGPRYTGELSRVAVVINEARRRGRVTGTDLLPRFAAAAPLDLFGIDAASGIPGVTGIEDLPHDALHTEMPAAAPTCTRSAGPRSACRCSRRCSSGCPSSRWPRPRRTRPCRPPRASCPTGSTCSPARCAASSRTRPRPPSEAGPRGRTRCVATASRGSSRTGTGRCTSGPIYRWR